MLEVVTQYLQSSCFTWKADKIKKLQAGQSSGAAPNTFSGNYYVIKKLGSGGYGTVFLVARKSDGKKFAAKVVPQARCRRTTFCTLRQMYIPDEVTIWEGLGEQENVLRLVESYLEKGHWILVTEYLPGFLDLFDYNIAIKRMSTEEVRGIVRQVAGTCQELLKKGIDHRDVKDENLLYNPETKQVRLIDFGSASVIDPDDTYTHIQGTDIYIPQEFYRCGSYKPEAGLVWALGCLAYILLNRRPPFVNREHVKTHEHLTWVSTEETPARDFIKRCLERDPDMRWDLQELIASEWLNGNEW